MAFQTLILSNPNEILLLVSYIFLAVLLFRSFFKVRNLSYFVNDDFDKLVWLFLATNLVSVVFAQNKYVALVRYRELVLPFMSIYFIAKNELRSHRLKIIISILFLIGVIISLFGILEFIFNKNILYGIFPNPYYREHISSSRVMSLMVHPAVLGTYIICCLPCAYFMLEEARGEKKRLRVILGILCILTALVLTFSRSSWVIAMIVTAFYFYQKNRKSLLWAILAVSITLAFIPLVAGLKPQLKERVKLDNAMYYLTRGHRLQRYPLTLRMSKDHPLVGLGLNNYRFFFDRYYGANTIPYDIKVPENMYLMLLGESGLLGLGLFLLLIYGIIKHVFIRLREIKDDSAKVMPVIFAAFIGMAVNMFSYDLLYWTVPLFLFLFFLGSLSGYVKGTRYRISFPEVFTVMLGLFLFWLSLGTPVLHNRYINTETLYLIILYLIVTIYRFREHNFFGKEDWFIFSFVIILTLNPLFSEDKYRAIKIFRIFVPALLFSYLIGKNIAAKNQRVTRNIIFTLAGSLCAVGIVGIIEAVLKKNFVFGLIDYHLPKIYLPPERISSTMINPTVLGAYLAITFSSAFYILQNDRLRRAGLFIIAVAVVSLFLTFSRGAWIAWIISVLIYYRKRYGRLLVILFLVFILIFLLLFIFPENSYFLSERFGLKGTVQAILRESRIEYLPVMRRMFIEHPFLGIGMGHYKLLFSRYSNEMMEYIYMVPDNMYLTLIVETGILAFIAFTAFVIILLRRIYVYLKSEKEGYFKEEVRALGAGLTAFLVAMFTFDSFYWFALTGLFGLYAGLSSGIISRINTAAHKD